MTRRRRRRRRRKVSLLYILYISCPNRKSLYATSDSFWLPFYGVSTSEAWFKSSPWLSFGIFSVFVVVKKANMHLIFSGAGNAHTPSSRFWHFVKVTYWHESSPFEVHGVCRSGWFVSVLLWCTNERAQLAEFATWNGRPLALALAYPKSAR